ncbi:MAG: PAS domain-containing protein [Planctomycetaceae bacterium]
MVKPISPGSLKTSPSRKANEVHLNWLATIVESSSDAIIGLDETLKIHSWNKAAEEIFGYRREEAINQCISLLFGGENQMQVLNLLQDVADAKTGRVKENAYGIKNQVLKLKYHSQFLLSSNGIRKSQACPSLLRTSPSHGKSSGKLNGLAAWPKARSIH